MTSAVTKIINSSGLHARPATDFVNTAKKFQSKIMIRSTEESEDSAVNAKSVVLLLTLGLGPGTEVEITASGEDEAEAVNSLIALIDSGLGEC